MLYLKCEILDVEKQDSARMEANKWKILKQHMHEGVRREEMEYHNGMRQPGTASCNRGGSRSIFYEEEKFFIKVGKREIHSWKEFEEFFITALVSEVSYLNRIRNNLRKKQLTVVLRQYNNEKIKQERLISRSQMEQNIQFLFNFYDLRSVIYYNGNLELKDKMSSLEIQTLLNITNIGGQKTHGSVQAALLCLAFQVVT